MHGVTMEEEAYEDLVDLALTMSRALVDEPDRVEIHQAKGDGMLTLEVTCHPADNGSLIGARGKLAESMRSVLIAASAARGIRINVQFAPKRTSR